MVRAFASGYSLIFALMISAALTPSSLPREMSTSTPSTVVSCGIHILLWPILLRTSWLALVHSSSGHRRACFALLLCCDSQQYTSVTASQAVNQHLYQISLTTEADYAVDPHPDDRDSGSSYNLQGRAATSNSMLSTQLLHNPEEVVCHRFASLLDVPCTTHSTPLGQVCHTAPGLALGAYTLTCHARNQLHTLLNNRQRSQQDRRNRKRQSLLAMNLCTSQQDRVSKQDKAKPAGAACAQAYRTRCKHSNGEAYLHDHHQGR